MVQANVFFDTNGQVYGGSVGYQPNWYGPTTTGIGSAYWIKFTSLATTGTSTEYGTLNTWLQLNATQGMEIRRTLIGIATRSYVYQISTDSSGSNIVGSGTIALSVELSN